MQNAQDMHIEYVPITSLNPSPYNPRKWDESAKNQLKESIGRFGVVDPLICNRAAGRENVVIGGHFRLGFELFCFLRGFLNPWITRGNGRVTPSQVRAGSQQLATQVLVIASQREIIGF